MAEANKINNYFKPSEINIITEKEKKSKQDNNSIFARSIKRKFSDLCDNVESMPKKKKKENIVISTYDNTSNDTNEVILIAEIREISSIYILCISSNRM